MGYTEPLTGRQRNKDNVKPHLLEFHEDILFIKYYKPSGESLLGVKKSDAKVRVSLVGLLVAWPVFTRIVNRSTHLC